MDVEVDNQRVGYMNHAQEINKIIQFAAQRPGFQGEGYQSFEGQTSNNLKQTLEKANLFFTCSVLGMEAVSHVIEDQAMSLGGKFRFYTAFQKFSRLKPQESRYRKLLTLGNPVYIFGIPDGPVWSDPNLKQINLERPSSPDVPNLSQNWFVVLNNPQFVSMALVARELPTNQRPVGAPDKLVYRNFEGFWTYDKDVISAVVTILDDYIEQNQLN